MKKYNTAIIHFLFWIGYVTIAILVYGYGHDDWKATCLETIYSHLVSAGVFYTTSLYCFPKLFVKKRFVIFILSLISILAISILLRLHFIYELYPSIMGEENSVANNSIELLSRKFFFQWFTFSLYSFFYWRSTTDKDKAKREKLELENAALRAQINPHFTMNTLDLFRAQSVDSNPNLSFGLGWFMKILKAGIVTPESDGRIQLKIETEAIRGTIYIFKERFPNIQLDHKIEIDNVQSYRILPHILLPLVENAFKHGAYKDKLNKIRVELTVKEYNLRLKVFNKKGEWIKDSSTGIGLRYVKRNLESGYCNKHKLVIDETDETFTVDLSVQLK